MLEFLKVMGRAAIEEDFRRELEKRLTPKDGPNSLNLKVFLEEKGYILSRYEIGALNRMVTNCCSKDKNHNPIIPIVDKVTRGSIEELHAGGSSNPLANIFTNAKGKMPVRTRGVETQDHKQKAQDHMLHAVLGNCMVDHNFRQAALRGDFSPFRLSQGEAQRLKTLVTENAALLDEVDNRWEPPKPCPPAISHSDDFQFEKFIGNGGFNLPN
ncbi:MAG: hypothetical protein QNK37_16525 [Acidobacteriota bacterium]|nr:hypothetical protein [Acidobacteriota bacterium]